MSEINVNKIAPSTGTNVTLGDASDTFKVPSGVTLDVESGATLDVTGATVSGLTSTTINNNADNRIITGSGTANTLNGEANLTFDGTNLDLADSKKIRFGTGNDFEIYHDGSNSIIHDGGTGDLLIRAEDDLRLQDTSGYDYIHCNTDSSVELYHNKVKKLETASTGVTVTGDAQITNALIDQWRVTTSYNNDANPITSNWEQVDTSGQVPYRGNASLNYMTQSSGNFTFPTTGTYLVRFYIALYNADDRYLYNLIAGTRNNSSYYGIAQAYGFMTPVGGASHLHVTCETLWQVTNTSNDKVRFGTTSNNQNGQIVGDSTTNATYVTFQRVAGAN